jgi:hypothetical protein
MNTHVNVLEGIVNGSGKKILVQWAEILTICRTLLFETSVNRTRDEMLHETRDECCTKRATRRAMNLCCVRNEKSDELVLCANRMRVGDNESKRTMNFCCARIECVRVGDNETKCGTQNGNASTARYQKTTMVAQLKSYANQYVIANIYLVKGNLNLFEVL